MNTESILSAIRKHIALSEDEADYFVRSLVAQKVKQGDVVEKAGEKSRHFIYVNSGCLMTYYPDPQGHDHVMQFATSGWWTGDLHSFVSSECSIYDIRALADSEIFLLTKNALDSLLEKQPTFERYFRILFLNALVAHQQRIIEGFSNTAEGRYESFQKRFPTLEQFVPLKYIASYLGITPEFLSKIRRKQLVKQAS